MPFIVYALLEADNATNSKIYIGMTSNTLKTRLSQHLSEARRNKGFDGYDFNHYPPKPEWNYRCYCRKCEWIRSLNGKAIRIEAIHSFSSKEEAAELESRLSRLLINTGQLVNSDKKLVFETNVSRPLKRQLESEQEYPRRKAVERDRSIRNARAVYQSALQSQVEFLKRFNDSLGK